MKNRVAKRLLSALAVLVLALGLGLAGCGGSKTSEEDLIRAAVSEVMETFKNPTKENIEQYVADTSSLEEFEQYGIDPYDFMSHAFSRFDYSIGSVTIDGDKAKVELTVTNANLNDCMAAATAVLADNAEAYTDLYTAEDGVQQLMQILMDEFYAQVDATSDLVTTNATLTLTKVDGEWDVDDESMQAVASAMLGGVEV